MDKGFQQVYSQNPETGCYILEIALDRYSDIFNEWDPAPFKRRDLDPYLQLYLEESSDEIPMRYSLEICFQIPPDLRQDTLEQDVSDGLKNCLSFRLYLLSKEQHTINRYILIFTIAGLALVAGTTFFRDRLEDTILLSTLLEGLLVSGWVLLWEAVSLVVFKKRELWQRSRCYQRLQRSPIRFVDSVPESV